MEFLVQDAFGVSSLRQCAGFPDEGDHSYHAPLGCCIVEWDINSMKKSWFQAHSDLITVMVKNSEDNVLTVSFSGEVKLWKYEKEFSILSSFQTPTDNIIFGSWSIDGKSFSLCSKGPKQMILVYCFTDVVEACKEKNSVKPSWLHVAPQTSTENRFDKQSIYDCFNASKFKKTGELIAVYQSDKRCELYLFSSTGNVLKTAIVSPLADKKDMMLCISEVHDDIIAIGLQNGVFGFYNVNTLNMHAVMQSTGSPQICIWDMNNRFVTLSYLSGIISWWDCNGVLLQEFKGGPTGSNVQMSLSATSVNSYWIGGIMSLHFVTLSTNESRVIKSSDISFLSLTGCGLAVSETNIVASGDFTGKVLLWQYSQDHPFHSLVVSSQIRCLLWYHTYLLIGCLDGEIYSYLHKVNSNQNEANNIYNCYGGVVTMELNHKQTKLAVGTTTGNLYVFTVEKGEDSLNLILLYQSLQHQPKLQPDKSELSMEIWSLTWNDAADMIASTSEDQTTVVCKADSGQIIHVLTGHTTAVTSVSWRTLSTGKKILVTCADDRTVRIHDGGETYKLLHVADTYDIYGWHTLTYLLINTKMDFLICATQNGYLVVWDLITYQCVAKRKLHGGSIEGLAMDKNQDFIFTTSSDCVVQRFSLSNIRN